MKTNEREFFRCPMCGNIVGMIEENGPIPVCCGKPMVPLIPNTVEAAHEKHVPAVVREGRHLTVTVGSVPHPMTEEHHIAWIAIAQGHHTQREELEHTGAPAAKFHVEDGPVKVYAYCNLHGLWSADA